jgi:epoxide hydrolase-like predicted phosphatase
MDFSPMNRYRAIFVDFGGVLYRQPDPHRTAKWLKRLGIQDIEALTILYRSPLESQLVMEVMTGQREEQQIWDDLAKSWKVRPGILNFLRNRGYSKRRLNVDLIQYIESLRGQYKTAILTNAGTDFRHTFCKIFQLADRVDQVIISAEEQIAKPDVRFFQLAAQRMGVAPEEAIFLDDMAVNVEGARQAGCTAFQHIEERQSILQLQSLLSQSMI